MPSRRSPNRRAFEEAFEKYYAGIIDLNLTNEIDNFDVVRVDPKALEVETKSGIKLKGAVVNVIPPQTAGSIAAKAGCTEGAWCPIRPQNFMSAKADGIYVIGDAAIAAEMPKSAFSANSQGRVVAADLLADLKGGDPVVARYRNTCWSLLAAEDSIKIGADYTPGDKDGKPILVPHDPFISQKGEGPRTAAQELRREPRLVPRHHLGRLQRSGRAHPQGLTLARRPPLSSWNLQTSQTIRTLS